MLDCAQSSKLKDACIGLQVASSLYICLVCATNELDVIRDPRDGYKLSILVEFIQLNNFISLRIYIENSKYGHVNQIRFARDRLLTKID